MFGLTRVFKSRRMMISPKEVRDNLTDGRLIRWAIRACYGNPDWPESYIPDAENRVTPSWFAFHNARSTLTLIGIFLKKYGLRESPGKKFPNTKLDIDYLTSLHYADALASDETSGDMDEMCNWLYGSNKKRSHRTPCSRRDQKMRTFN